MKLKTLCYSTLLSLIIASTSCSHIQKYQAPVAKTLYSFKDFRPANMAISSSGRVFVTGHPIVNSKRKVVEVFSDNKYKVYPNDKYANSTKAKSIIGATIGIHVDSKDNLWVLDMANHQFVVWNIKKNKLNRSIKIPKSALVEHSFVQDFVLDEKRNRVIIADMSQGDLKSAPKPAFIAIDLKSGKAYRVAEGHESMQPDFEGGLALNPISIDPNYEYVYFGAMHSKKIYRVKAESFDSPKTLAKHIEYYAPKPYSDGFKVDGNGNVYTTDIEAQALGVSNNKGYKIIAKLPKEQSWPDGIFVKDGFVYAVVNQLNRTAALNNGVDATKGGFIIVKTPIAK